MKRHNIIHWVFSFIIFIVLGQTGQAKTIYVDDSATGANDGSNWTNAYNYLQDALAVASSGDKIWVAQGKYKPDQGAGKTPGDQTATFQLKNGVILKGGLCRCWSNRSEYT